MTSYRGDVTATVGGRVRRLRLTFEGLAAIEERLEAGIVAVAERFPARCVGTRDVSVILKEGLKGGGETLSDEDIAALIMEVGFVPAARLAGKVLAAALGQDASAETEAESLGKSRTGVAVRAAPFPGGKS